MFSNITLKSITIKIAFILVTVYFLYCWHPLGWWKHFSSHKNEVQLTIKCVAVTGPNYFVLDDNTGKGVSKNSGIELLGEIPEKILPYPEYYNTNFIVIGNYAGETDKYNQTEAGSIPVFEVVEIIPTKYLPYLIFGDLNTKSLILGVLNTILFFIFAVIFFMKRN